MARARSFNPESSLEARALQAWLILIGVAHQHQTITYWDLSTLMHGHPAPQTVNRALGRVVRFCERHELPRLSVLVVDKITGLPGDTDIYEGVDVNAERQRVFNYGKWYELHPPSVDELTS